MKKVIWVGAVALGAVAIWYLFLRKRFSMLTGRPGIADRSVGSTLRRPPFGNLAGGGVSWLEPSSSPVSNFVGGTAMPTPTGGYFSPWQVVNARVTGRI